MIIKLYESGSREIKKYDNFKYVELNTIFKNKNLNSKYNLEFYGDDSEILKAIMNDVFNDYKNVYANYIL